MIKGIIFDYGGTLDTRGNHWGKVLWHAYERQQIPVTEEQFREAYVYAERTLGRNPIILPTYTFKKLLDVKLRLEMEYLFTKGYWTIDKNTYTKMELALLDDLYGQVRQTVAYSREILLQLKERSHGTGQQLLWEHRSGVTGIPSGGNVPEDHRVGCRWHQKARCPHLPIRCRCFRVCC